mmetsp:Transcript_17329/g.29304  ORF Transcript_17329/g.29304 Transcript_17329/m.29304 type:complete len:427 (+) Transcript_17329:273-1553(+)
MMELKRIVSGSDYEEVVDRDNAETQYLSIYHPTKSSALSTDNSKLELAMHRLTHLDRRGSITKKRKIELTELCDLFLGPWGKRVFSLVIAVYMYGTLWAYCTVFAKAFAAVFGASYELFLAIFACVVVPLSCMELSEQIYVQVSLSIFRVIMLVVMLLTTAVPYFYRIDAFGDDMSNLSYGNERMQSHADFHVDQLDVFLPVATFAFIFHHSVPVLSEPIADKQTLGKMFSLALVGACVGYTVMAACVSLYFWDNTLSSSNLNWAYFVGNRNANGSIPLYAYFISNFIILFPAVDVASAYPLNALTLGNNLMSSYFGEKIDLYLGSKLYLTSFRLLAAIPPFVGAMVVRELGHITAFTGLTGFAIAFIFPGLLSIASLAWLTRLRIPTRTIHSRFWTTSFWPYCLVITGAVLLVAVATGLLVKSTG